MQSKVSQNYGNALLKDRNGTIYLYFPRACFNGEQKSISLGLKATAKNWKIAEGKLEAVNSDITLGQFDITLERYKAQNKQRSYQDKITRLFPSVCLVDCYTAYMKHKGETDKVATRLERERTILPKLIASKIVSIDNANALYDYLFANFSESMTKRVLMQVYAAYEWNIKHGKIKGDTEVYANLISDLKHNYEKDATPNAFNAEEKERILNYFKNHDRVYYPYVFFLFATGCRPAEATGLYWTDINFSTNKITFDGGISYTQGQWINTKGSGSKTGNSRKFPMNATLYNFLQSLPKLNQLVFPTSFDKPVNYQNFGRRSWKRALSALDIEHHSAYSCRATFISEQIVKGVAPMQVAKWCDTSVGMIEKHYYDDTSSIVPM